MRFSYTTETDGNEVETVITINEYDGSVVSKEVIPLRAADGSTATAQVGGRAELKNAAQTQAMEDELNALPRGRSPEIREVASEEELNSMYARWTKGGQPANDWNDYRGTLTKLPDGTRVGYRMSEKSGPTVDINLPDGTRYKVHIHG